ncbi:hypothetical protein CERSUDRAFT_112074 [Gelatoporia subvermispora B]|uniref:Uncharacterized protein n=1 Tax=Ceriporiopsis subvermispora (strain B) TaxID=914234 RepID=M2QRU6_CERS8|nr:hypothetical protein CERSUDRAFT_112074 [Gelatoporia subvermispora B]
MQGTHNGRKYTAEQKHQLLANLDLEVAHRTKRLEELLQDMLENFTRHQETLISRVPRLIRSVTLKELAKYNGDVQLCLREVKKQALGGEESILQGSPRKRKWLAAQDPQDEKVDEKPGQSSTRDVESSRGVKSARTMFSTPKKPAFSGGPGQKPRFPLTKTPGTTRTANRIPSGHMSPSPHKGTKSSLLFRAPSRPPSPSKIATPSKSLFTSQSSKQTRVPSSSTFNPSIPSASYPRWPRQNERLLSVNGSPLANPYTLDLGTWLKSTDGPESEGELGSQNAGGALKKKNSIIIRSVPPQASGSQSNSHAINAPSTHSRSNSQTTSAGFVPSRADGSPAGHTEVQASFAALVSVPTQDGHILEFDPLKTSPAELDALEGISDSAKKQAREDMARLIQAAVERWKIS